jgi:hypothetical protein
VNGVSQRIEDGAVVLGNAGVELDDVGGRNFDELGEGAVLIDADDFEILADVSFADATLQTVASIDVHFSADEIAGFDGGDFIADVFDDATEFVAEGYGGLDAALGPAIPTIDMEVGAADGGGADANQDVGGADGGDGDGFEGKTPRRLHLAQSFHGGSHRLG